MDNSDILYLNLKLDDILERLNCRNDKDPAHGKDEANDISEIKREMNDLKNKIEELSVIKEEVKDNKDYMAKKYLELKKERETVYTRWGRTTCPGNNSDAVYSGYAGGSSHVHTGAAASMLCLPKDPDWDVGKYSDTKNDQAGLLYDTEYQEEGRSDLPFGRSHYQHDVPCVVCNVRGRSSTIMVPGKTRCHAGWTFEYSGYLMSGRYSHAAATDYYCVDRQPEDVPGSIANKNGYLLYFVEARCGSLLCPPYADGREFSCVVCTK